jgi:basic membrane protein A
MDRRTFIKGAGTAGIVGLAGCTGGPTEGGATGTDQPTDAEQTASGNETDDGASGDAVNVGMVYATGGLGDGSFNDQAQQGIKKAAQELGVKYDEAQPSEVSQFKTFQTQFAKSTSPAYDLISCIGFLQADALSETAPAYPEQNFMIVDSVVDEPNVGSYVFAEHEGSFLVGQLAGLLTAKDFSAGAGATTSGSSKLGFVGGVESPLIKKFEAGFIAGAKYANDSVEVQSTYVGSFNDPAGGKEAALAMYNNGADIVYHASGNTGTGVFQAAQQKGRFAIGVDRDQSVTKPSYADVILASMVKRVDTAVYNSVKSVVNGTFEGGSTTALGLKDEGVAIVYGKELGAEISEDVKSKISTAKQAIIDGEITVPKKPENA